jgi:glycosyl transferase family 25
MSENIDKIIYINLEKRTDRRTEIENELAKFELPYERFNAIEYKGPYNKSYSDIKGAIGCGYSHLQVLKIAKERGYKNILILEDDFTFLVSKEEFENQMTKLFNDVGDFDVCMLSFNSQKEEPVLGKDYLTRVLEAYSGAAYIVNNHYYDEIIKLFEDRLPKLIGTGMHWLYAIDTAWGVLQQKDKWYRFNTRTGKQRPGYSDNMLCHISETTF